jgi:hypothetical protein
MTQKKPEPNEQEPEPKPNKTGIENFQGTPSWTVCYNNSSLVHYNAKMRSAWFSSTLKKKDRRGRLFF